MMRCTSECQFRSIRAGAISALAVTALMVVAIANSAAAQTAETTKSQTNRPIHIVRMVVNRDGKANRPPASTHLNYYGGPVMSNINVVTVFWTSAVDAGVQTTMPEFYSAITNSTYYDLLSEYATNVTPLGGGSGTNQFIGRGSSGGTFTIAPSSCNDGTPCTIDDTAIQTELLDQINAGHLPAPELDNNGNVNTIYMIYFPLNVTITQDGSQSCVVFCAYHGTTSAQYKLKNLEYGVFPDMGPSSSCFGGCGTDPNYLNDTTSVSSHELAEAATDAEVGIATVFGPPLAWYDAVNGEIGDICDAQQANVTAGGSTWTVQELWSNTLNACVAVGEHPVYVLSAPGNATNGTSFSITLTAQNPTSGGTMTSYIGTVNFSSSDGAAVLPANYTFTNNDQGTHTFSGVILKTGGSQTITAQDNINSAVKTSATISVSGGANGPLTVSPASLSFPSTVVTTTSTSKLITFTNSNALPVSISTVGFTGTNPGDFVVKSNTCGANIPANSFCKIGVAFAPTALGARSAALVLTDSATNSPQSVALSGTGVLPATLVPTQANFSTVVLGTTSTAKTFTLANNQTVALTGMVISVTGDFAVSATTCTTSLNAKSKCTISVTFTPTATGKRTGTLSVSDSATNSPQSAALSGTGVLAATLTPTSATYPILLVGTTSAAKTFTLTNNQTIALTGIVISTTGDFAVSTTTCTTSLNAKSKCTIGVTFTPTATSKRTGTLTVSDNANNSPQTSSLTGTGK